MQGTGCVFVSADMRSIRNEVNNNMLSSIFVGLLYTTHTVYIHLFTLPQSYFSSVLVSALWRVPGRDVWAVLGAAVGSGRGPAVSANRSPPSGAATAVTTDPEGTGGCQLLPKGGLYGPYIYKDTKP